MKAEMRVNDKGIVRLSVTVSRVSEPREYELLKVWEQHVREGDVHVDLNWKYPQGENP